MVHFSALSFVHLQTQNNEQKNHSKIPLTYDILDTGPSSLAPSAPRRSSAVTRAALQDKGLLSSGRDIGRDWGTCTVRRPAGCESGYKGCCWGEDDPFVRAVVDKGTRGEAPPPGKKRCLSQMFKEKEDGASIPQGSNDGTTRGDGDHGHTRVTRAEAELTLALEGQAAALRPTLEVDDHPRVRCKDAEESKMFGNKKPAEVRGRCKGNNTCTQVSSPTLGLTLQLAAAIFEKEREYLIQTALTGASHPVA
ncbi:hypothetical protein EDB85DRAFT_1888500 [Lactarius pseudohatsudake]|nr:hypothetical protein EDB85DRAFT_1888500 [Lactarius pseudohatsudake]